MSRKPPMPLPDLEDHDAAFQRRMKPLVERALPNDRRPDNRPGVRESRKPDNPCCKSCPTDRADRSRSGAAHRRAAPPPASSLDGVSNGASSISYLNVSAAL